MKSKYYYLIDFAIGIILCATTFVFAYFFDNKETSNYPISMLGSFYAIFSISSGVGSLVSFIIGFIKYFSNETTTTR